MKFKSKCTCGCEIEASGNYREMESTVNHWLRHHQYCAPVEPLDPDVLGDTIDSLSGESFEGWHPEAIKGYQTALVTIKKQFVTVGRNQQTT